jgi:hypothetical protein
MKQQTGVQYIQDNFSMNKTLGEIKIIIATALEKQRTIDFAYDIADDLACGVYDKKAIEDIYKKFFKK